MSRWFPLSERSARHTSRDSGLPVFPMERGKDPVRLSVHGEGPPDVAVVIGHEPAMPVAAV